MTHRERLLAALRREVPDQVPVTWELVGRCAHAFTGRGDWKAQCDAHRMIGSSIFNLQGVGPQLSFPAPDGYGERAESEPQPDGSTITTRTIFTPHGSLTERTHGGYLPDDPLLTKRIEYPVKQRADYEIYADYMEACLRNASFSTERSEEARGYIGEDGLVGYWMSDALYAVSWTRHDAEFIVDLMEEPDLMHRLLEIADERVKLGLRAFNESAADVMVLDICWASTSLLSPSLARQYVVPRARRAVEMVGGDKIIGFFTSGRIRDVLGDLADLGPAFIQHLDVLGDCDLAEVKRTFGERFCLMGNYNPVVLAHSTREQAQHEARRCLEAAMEGGGYVMSTSDEVPADAKLENMRAVVEYVAEHGRYD